MASHVSWRHHITIISCMHSPYMYMMRSSANAVVKKE